MKRFIISALAVAITSITTTRSFAEETLWDPADFDGAWVHVVDRVKNGCWTNIGEVKAYATDQLGLAGFKLIENPEELPEGPEPILDDNGIVLVLKVEGTRWPNGVCIGSMLAYFIGSVVPRRNPDQIVVNPIGIPGARAIWDKDKLNTILLDEIKIYISDWVEAGKLRESEN